MVPQYAFALGLAAVISAAVAFYAWNRRPAAGASGLALSMLAMTAWALPYAFRWMAGGRDMQLFWLDSTYLGVVVAPSAFLILTLQFTNRARYLTRRYLILMAIEPVLTLILLWTDPVHNLFYGGVRTTGSILTGGPWFWINVVYSYGLLLVVAVLLARAYIYWQPLYRRHAGTLLLGMFFPWIGSAVGLAGLSPFPDLDITPFVFILSGLIMTYGLFRYRLLDIGLIARDKLVESMSDGVIVLNVQQVIVDLNPAAQRIFGLSRKVIGLPADSIFEPWPELIKIFHEERETSTEIQTSKDTPDEFEVRVSHLFDTRHTLTGRLILLRDITGRKQAEEDLRASEERYRSVIQSAMDAIITIDGRGTIIAWNQGAQQIFQYSETEILGQPLSILMPESYRGMHREALERLSSGGEPRMLGQIIKITGLRKDRQEIPIEIVLSSWQSGKTVYFTGIIRDITDRQQMEDALRYQSTHDFLTGLFNRQYFETELDRLQQSRQFPVSILMMDVDGLKRINDTIGHGAGDDLLRRAAQVLKPAFRQEDMVARIGGDEFAAILPNTSEATAMQILLRLQINLEDHNQNYPADQALCLSVGAACGGENEQLSEVLKKADQAMYRQKIARKI